MIRKTSELEKEKIIDILMRQATIANFGILVRY